MQITGPKKSLQLGRLILPAVLIAFGAAIYLPYRDGDYLLTGAAALVCFGCMLGYVSGATKMIGMAIGGGLGLYFSAEILEFVGPYLGEFVQKMSKTYPLQAAGATAAACSMSCSFLLQFILSLFGSNRPSFQQANARMGFVLGGLQAAALAALVVCGSFTLEPLASKRLMVPIELDPHPVAREVAGGVLYVSRHADAKPYGRVLRENNPFDKVEQLKAITDRINSAVEAATQQTGAAQQALEMTSQQDLISAIKKFAK